MRIPYIMNQEINTIPYFSLCACFGLEPSSAEASVLIREAYVEPENAPRLPRNTDVVYYSAAPDSAVAEAPQAYAAIISGAGIPCRGSFLFCRLDAAGCLLRSAVLSNARKIRAFLFADGPGFPRTILRKAGIRPVPDPPEPMLLHEPEGSLWRERI